MSDKLYPEVTPATSDESAWEASARSLAERNDDLVAEIERLRAALTEIASGYGEMPRRIAVRTLYPEPLDTANPR